MGLGNLIKAFSPKPTLKPTYKPNPYADEYYTNMQQVEVMWSVLQNLKAFHTPQAYQLEQACKKNIEEYKLFVANDQHEQPRKAYAFIRLAMLYEKQERWSDGIKVCVDAIQSGAYEDGSNGKMYGRLARFIKKSGMEVSEDILKLTKEPQDG